MDLDNLVGVKKTRGRGRPKKNVIQVITPNEERDIILFLPIKNSKQEIADKSDIFQLSIDSDSSDGSSTNGDLSEQLKEKNKLIRKLKEQLSKGTSEHIPVIVYKLNTKLFDASSGKNISVKKTDISCWWCTYKFDTPPVFLPDRTHGDEYYVFGCFCSCNCAAAYNFNMSDYKLWDRHSMLISLYREFVGDTIQISPPKECLDKYGGPLTIEEYRKNFLILNKNCRIIMPPMISIVPLIEIKDKHSSNKGDFYKSQFSKIFSEL